MNRVAPIFEQLVKFMPFIRAYLLMVIIGLQSVFAAQDICVAGENTENPAGYSSQYIGQMNIEQANVPGQAEAHEDCSDCDCKCCPCCANVMFAPAALLTSIDSVDFFLSPFESTYFDSPYYLLLRPPKI